MNVKRLLLLITVIFGVSQVSCNDGNHDAKAVENSKSTVECGASEAVYKSKVFELAQVTSNTMAQDIQFWNKTIEVVTLLCSDSKTVPYAKCSELKDQIVVHRDQMNENKSTMDRIVRMKPEVR